MAGSFEALADAEEAAHRKPRVQAMKGSVQRRGGRPGLSGDKARSFLIMYRNWAAVTRQQIEGEEQWKDIEVGSQRDAAVREELKRRWRAYRGGPGQGPEHGNARPQLGGRCPIPAG